MARDFSRLSVELASVVVFQNISRGPVLGSLRELLSAAEAAPVERAEKFGNFLRALYDRGCDLGGYLKTALLEDENLYVRLKGAGRPVPGPLTDCVERELALFTRLSELDPGELQAIAGENVPGFLNTAQDFGAIYHQRVAQIHRHGYGIFAAYTMFQVDEAGRIVPVRSADKTQMSELVGYEAERQKVADNTLALLRGLPAANVLLCGDAGTGKSSTVKAVANLYAKEGVRLLELRKDQLRLLPQIMGELSENPLKFIVFVDDLSFHKNDDTFSSLKAILEGSSAAKASNVVIYATSNRRHLVKETFSDREGDDVHRGDTMQEIMSLSERFGLTVLFAKPDKALYLRIVRSLALEKGIKMDDESLCMQAEAFALRKGGRSARAAEQFTDSLLSSKVRE